MEWISVEDLKKLPKSIDPESEWGSRSVLITDGENVSVGYFEPEYFAPDDENPIQYSSEVWNDDANYLKTNISGFAEVTHWMELPLPPKEKDENISGNKNNISANTKL